MPSLMHEALIALFRNRPSLAPELLEIALNASVPPFDEATTESAELNQVTPTEYRADLVVLLHQGRPVLAIVVEVQLERDSDKRWVWPAYLSTLRERLRCPACLLVVCPDQAVARWCSRPIAVGPGGFELRPFVLGPEAVPVVTEQQVASEAPELAVLSAMAHGQSERGFDVGKAALEAVKTLDEDRLLFYNDLVVAALSEAAHRSLEALMRPEGYEYQSDFARKYFGKGKAEGKAEGEAKGKAEGLTKSLMTFLTARGFEVSEEIRDTIVSCRDLDQLDEWIRRAATATSLDQVFD